MDFTQFSALFANDGLAVVKTSAIWNSVNPILPAGTICIEQRTGNSYQVKIADGTTAWASLPYIKNKDISLRTFNCVCSAGQTKIYPPFVWSGGNVAEIILFVGGLKYRDDQFVLSADGTITLTTPLPDSTVVDIIIFNTYTNSPIESTGYNHIIDGDFDYWFEGTSQTTSGYGSATMWFHQHTYSTKTHSRQSFAIGEVFPDGPPTPTYFSRTVVTGSTTAGHNALIYQCIEDVTKFSNKTITLSLYAKADSAKTLMVAFNQNFGTGGSATVGTWAPTVTLSTSWKKYTFTVTLPSISGKTIGASNHLKVMILFDIDSGPSGTPVAQSGTFDIAMIRLVEGLPDVQPITRPKWKDFLLLCRYFQLFGDNDGTTCYQYIGLGVWYGTLQFTVNIKLIVPMRLITPVLTVNNPALFNIYPTSVSTLAVNGSPMCADALMGITELIGTTTVNPSTLSKTSILMPANVNNAKLIFDARI